jgi:transcriptional regulator with PAS, ATPase and Fis domain
MCVLVSGDVLENDDLNDRILDEVRTSGRNYQVKGKLKESVEQYEREQIIDGLKRNEGNKSALAREMGISRTALTQKMKKYKVTG